MSSLINLKNVNAGYIKDGVRQTVLSDITVQVAPQECVTLMGPSGCGKTTLLNLLLGATQPHSGTVEVAGHCVERVTGNVGIVYQDYGLFKHLTLLDNITIGRLLEQTNLLQRIIFKPFLAAARVLDSEVLDVPDGASATLRGRLAQRVISMFKCTSVLKQARVAARELLLQCDLNPDKHGHKYPAELSGGQRQRAAIAQAIIMRPDVLLMDEPFSGLDPVVRAEMQEFIYQQRKQHNLTILFVTHDLNEAFKLGTRVLCLSQYWCQDDNTPGIGARLLVDRQLESGHKPPEQFEKTDELLELMTHISGNAMNPDKYKPLSFYLGESATESK